MILNRTPKLKIISKQVFHTLPLCFCSKTGSPAQNTAGWARSRHVGPLKPTEQYFEITTKPRCLHSRRSRGPNKKTEPYGSHWLIEWNFHKPFLLANWNSIKVFIIFFDIRKNIIQSIKNIALIECCNMKKSVSHLIQKQRNTQQKYTILPQILGHPLLMKRLTTLVISMSTNLNV